VHPLPGRPLSAGAGKFPAPPPARGVDAAASSGPDESPAREGRGAKSSGETLTARGELLGRTRPAPGPSGRARGKGAGRVLPPNRVPPIQLRSAQLGSSPGIEAVPSAPVLKSRLPRAFGPGAGVPPPEKAAPLLRPPWCGSVGWWPPRPRRARAAGKGLSWTSPLQAAL